MEIKNRKSVLLFGTLCILFVAVIEVIYWKSYPMVGSLETEQETPEWQYALYIILILVGIIVSIWIIKKKLIDLPKMTPIRD